MSMVKGMVEDRIELLQVTLERDELARQLDDARRLACHYADLLHQAHGSRGIIEPDWKAS